ncbi:MAG: hypothetical protein ABJK37_12465 [Paraglaciecola sp.]|uniref:lipoyl protein ligase domain-containing protein n=1 Tax=Paraglaciecola sp. TaxID=1920173 RepID=UPI003299DFE7
MTGVVEVMDPSYYLSLLHCDNMLKEQQRITSKVTQPIEKPEVMFWRYDSIGIILGCSQRLSDQQITLAEQYELPWIRRSSGGGAVLAGPWTLSVTLFLPIKHTVAKGNIIGLFSWLEDIWFKVLAENNVDCRAVDKDMIVQSKDYAKKNKLEWACYGSLSHGEIVCNQGQKLVGIAQIRKATGVTLVSGLNLFPFDWQPLSAVFNNNNNNINNSESAALLARNNSYCSQLTSLSIDKLVPKIIKSFMDILPSDFTASPIPNKQCETLIRNK